MAKKPAGETNLPLVISLVFFVLTTIGLGVFVYVLYSDQAAKDQATAKATGDLAKVRAQVEESDLKWKMYRTLLGVEDPDDRTALTDADAKKAEAAYNELKRFNESAGKRMSAAADAEVKKSPALLKGFQPPADLFAWKAPGDGKLNLPTKALLDGAVAAHAAKDLAVKERNEAKAAYEAAVATLQTNTTELVAAQKKFLAAADNLPKEAKKVLDDVTKKMDDRLKAFAEAEKKTRDVYEATADELAKEKTVVKKREDAINNLKLERDALLQARPKGDTLQFEEPQGKILRRLPDDLVEINLGSADLVRRGLTFTVLPTDFPEKGKQSRMRNVREQDERGVFKDVVRFVPKGTLEVVEVMGTNLSKARLTENDTVRDRVLPGDLLYNAAWRRGAAEHVALIGVFDTNGDGTDDISRVVRDLTGMGIPVDAYYDLGKRQWVGKITTQTRYLVEGARPVPAESDPYLKAKAELIGKVSEATKAAQERGVTVVTYRDFFPRMGYRVRLDVTPERTNQAVTRYIQGIVVEEPKDGTSPEPK